MRIFPHFCVFCGIKPPCFMRFDDVIRRIKHFYINKNIVISVKMALPESIFVIFAGASLNALIIIGLYTRWIIPTIVNRVRDELMENIENWINSTKEDLSNTITLNIDEMRQKIVAMISGHRGNKARQLTLATEFLTANLDDPNNTDSEQYSDVLTQAIATYGEKIVKSALKTIQTKPAAEQPPAVW